jgi:fimbrial chaperone protein
MPPKSFVFALLVFLMGATPAMAYKLTPMSQVLAPSGSDTTKSFEIVNDSAERVALEISITTLERDLDYTETNVNADENFLVYPPQLLLAPGARQTVRVTWVGEPNLKSELAYRLVVEELPIKGAGVGSTKASGAVRILMTFRATLYIRPAKATPRISLESAVRVEGKTPSDASSLAITVQNKGTAQGALKKCATTASSGKTTVSLPVESLKLLQQGRILSGNQRRFLIPWPAELPIGTVTVLLKCDVGS